MMPRLLLIALSAIAVTLASPQAQSPLTTTIVLVRHAEAIANAGTDPGLSEAGLARARALSQALEHAEVNAVITTQYQRTAMTGEPLATALKAPLIKVPVEGPVDGYVKQLVQQVLAKYAGGTVVIVGHSNTVPALVQGFSGVDVGAIAHDSYDRMFVVTTASAGSGRVVRAHYGPK
ncbi:MAG: histidine phosphatase family protein [Acidobacteriota bacterium]|nr:histidine phosphatase family protein [Acidobacteriota bacterium]